MIGKQQSGLSRLIDRRIENMKGKAAIHPDNVSQTDAAPNREPEGRSGLAKRIDARIASMKRT